MTIVAGMALSGSIDNLDMYTEMASTSSGKDVSLKSDVIKSSGQTLFDTTTKTDFLIGNRLYWGHVQVMILDEQLCRDGIGKVIKQMREHQQLRTDLNLVIAKDMKPEEAFSLTYNNEDIKSFGIQKILFDTNFYSVSSYSQLYKFNKLIEREGQDGVLPCISAEKRDDKNIPVITGSAVFLGDKLVGFIDQKETLSLLVARGQGEHGTCVCPAPGGSVSFRIKKNSADLKTWIENGQAKSSLSIDTDIVILENSSDIELLDKDDIKTLEKLLSDHIKSNVQGVISKLNNQFHSDAVGFGMQLYISDNKTWNQVKDSWSTDFLPSLVPEISVKATVKGSGPVFK